jgi:hypothetical protein
MLQHIERLRNKPEHVRKNIALGTAGALAALVFLGWGAATVAGGTLALGSNSLTPDATAPLAAAAAQTSSSFSNLVGAVGAAPDGTSGTDTVGLQIVDNGTSSTIGSKTAATTSAPEQTVIPF